jgi:3-deoxy-D-arabino-heptulosonate 7-phosphate (DAHP) synthase
LGIVTEDERSRCELVAEYADVLQIGARNMQNFACQDARQVWRPILLKRG